MKVLDLTLQSVLKSCQFFKFFFSFLTEISYLKNDRFLSFYFNNVHHLHQGEKINKIKNYD